MLTLSPGPSQVSPQTKADIVRAIQDGVLELSHRSSRFTAISRLCLEELRKYLNIPRDYRVFYFDSATHAWHSIAANVVEKKSFHFVQGAFSARAREASKLLGKDAQAAEVPWGKQFDFATVEIPAGTELITVCYNETSTGVKMQSSEVRDLHRKYPSSLLAVDITSCAGCVPVVFKDADIWYFSVQKGFGLPAGLGIAIVSPRAYERSEELSKRGKNLSGIWSWEKLDETMREDKHQTPHTPNVLNIYLLAKQCQRWNKSGGLRKRSMETLEKKKLIEKWVKSHKTCDFFVADTKHRSDTVVVITAEQKNIELCKAHLKKNKIELGSGYGHIKKNTFRIANFPAINKKMLNGALRSMAPYFSK